MRHRLALALLACSPILARAQQIDVTPADPGLGVRPLGTYDGVEPGEAQPPPAFHRVTHPRRRARAVPAAILTWPGFQPLGDGGSRFFVQTTQPVATRVQVEETRIVVIFPSTAIHLRNSARWLETRFFSTPVLRARLERRGRDMALVLYMRAQAAPRVSTEVAPGGNFHYVYVDFSPGDYAPVVARPPPPQDVRPAPPASEPPPAPARPLDPSLEALDDERPPALQH